MGLTPDQGPILIHDIDKAKAYYQCNTCGKKFKGYKIAAAKGYHKFCNRKCVTFPKRVRKPGSVRETLVAVTERLRKQKLNKFAPIIEYHVNNPGVSTAVIAIMFKTYVSTVGKALTAYYQRGGDTVLTLRSGIDTVRAINQETELNEKINMKMFANNETVT